ncbi:hypothetical protein BH20ACT24_BH20ACT24_21980 [soil metagenome]
MGDFEQLLARLEELLADLESLDPPLRDRVFELLDGVDEIHRVALHRLATLLGEERVNGLRQADPAVEWLLDAYRAGAEQTADAEAALGSIRPYIESHGGRVEVIEAVGGVVRLQLSGACSGCTASAITLQRGVEEALREHMAGFLAMEVSEVEAAPHPPPGPTLLQVQPLAGPARRHPSVPR